MRPLSIAAPALLLLLAAPSRGEVVARAETGFVVHQVAEVAAGPSEAWKALVEPAGWWNGEHTFSGNAANLALEPRAGGCFCETLPGEGEKGWLRPRGSVEHMRVVFAEEAKALRMVGALGPLQSEAVQGTLTITLKPVDGGTRITWDYVVGGYMRYKQEQIAPAVDKVIGEQLARLADKLGVKAPAAAPKAAPGMESGR
jgi:hypothetical protein